MPARSRREYATWRNMLQRCERPESPDFSRYGGRGISVCERWHSFAAFLADMGAKPEGMSIDRIDNDGNYEPGNCRWATKKEQGRNRRTNRKVTFNGETLTPAEWAERLGMSREVMHQRLKRWSTEEALQRPIRYTKRGRAAREAGAR